MKNLLALISTTLLVGCASQPLLPLTRIPFPEAEYSALPKRGSATVTGQVFTKTLEAELKTAAGNQIFLNPVTSYSLEWYEKCYLAKRQMESADPKLSKYIKKAIADKNGKFRFKKVPAGDYFVSTIIVWPSQAGDHGAVARKGSNLAERITVNEKEETKVILAP